jgi:hypothetical protein
MSPDKSLGELDRTLLRTLVIALEGMQTTAVVVARHYEELGGEALTARACALAFVVGLTSELEPDRLLEGRRKLLRTPLPGGPLRSSPDRMGQLMLTSIACVRFAVKYAATHPRECPGCVGEAVCAFPDVSGIGDVADFLYGCLTGGGTTIEAQCATHKLFAAKVVTVRRTNGSVCGWPEDDVADGRISIARLQAVAIRTARDALGVG